MHKDLYPVPPETAKNAWINEAKYKEMYEKSIKDPEEFWAKEAERLEWFKKWDKVKETSFKKPVSIKWFQGGKLNVSYNCIDRHLKKNADKVAFIWEADNPQTPSKKITYKELHQEVCRFSNILKKMGVKKGDVVTIYLPMIPEAAYAMLACTRIGAVHSVIFGGFAPDSIADRIIDGQSKYVVTADAGFRGNKSIALKENIDKALVRAPVEKVLVVKYAQTDIQMQAGRDIWYHDEVKSVSDQCEPEHMDAEDPLFILYTSGSTGKPKGVLHTTGGYLLWASMTHQYVFDYHDDDIYWCTADVGWVTGHSYVVYGPLANAATSLIFEGVPNYPTSSRFWEVVDKHQVSIFYSSPTALRSLMREGDAPVKKTSRKSLRILGTVGEPINPEAWAWYNDVVGEGRCPIVDTWWQTETGGHMITPLPGAIATKPGSATLPFFGVQPKLLTNEGKEIKEVEGEGVLVIADSWPGQMRTVYRNHDRFEETYFSTYPGYYFSGDGCRRDKDGYYWITGRVDDVINVSGHRIGTAEIESALVANSRVAEAAVVGYPHDIKGQGIYAFVTLKAGETPSEDIRKELIQTVRKEIGPIATPDLIQWAPGLPKTRSGKIMRRILRKIAENHPDQLGDTTTLSDPGVVQELVDNRLNR
ncbi:acetate--CoA ligase [Bdellovibrio bacteriovorus]|uniref:acetate--CoA ligase n=1 Tax=Bdellovibrio bacteriovorus TaxID=959 RepID=UPI0035A6F891